MLVNDKAVSIYLKKKYLTTYIVADIIGDIQDSAERVLDA